MTILYMDGFEHIPPPPDPIHIKSPEEFVEIYGQPDAVKPAKYVVHQVPQAVIDHLDPSVKEVLDLRPITYLDIPKIPEPMLRMARNTGKSVLASDLLEILAGDFDGDAATTRTVPTFTWTERYNTVDPIRKFFTGFWDTIHGFMGETKPRGFFPKVTRVEWGSGFGHQLRRRARILEPWNPVTVRPPRRFWVAAARFAGFNAYPEVAVTYLDKPKTADWSRYAFDSLCYGYRIQWKGGLVFELPKDATGFETFTISYPADFGDWQKKHSPRTLRDSERRARYSSTMDGNGKPRKQKR